MTLLDSLLSQAVRAVKEPRAAAADVIALGVPREALVPALFAVVAVTVILNALSETLAPSPLAFVTPFRMAMLILVMMLIFAFAVAKSGQMLGGTGEFRDALLLMIFLQAMFLPAILLQLVLLAVSPALAAFFILAVMFFLMWVHINFIAALHGFPSLWRAVGVLVLASVATFLVLVVVAPVFVTLEGVENV